MWKYEMRRREFILIFGTMVVASPVVVKAQKPTLPVVGFLNSGVATEFVPLVEAFIKGLNEMGFVEGRNVAIEYRWANGEYGRLRELAGDLVLRQVKVIAASGGTSAVLAAKAATKAIPIIFISGGDPVEDGLVGSLNRPDANVTGMTVYSTVLGAKRLELLRELIPRDFIAAVLVNPTGKTSEKQIVQATADSMGQRIRMLNVSTDRDLYEVFAMMVEEKVGGLLVTGDPLFTSMRDQLVLLSTRYGIPTVFPWREYVLRGGLLSYGTDLRDTYRGMARYVSRILKGDKPADLPTQRPSTFELVLNLKAARALGLSIPTSILLRANEVME